MGKKINPFEVQEQQLRTQAEAQVKQAYLIDIDEVIDPWKKEWQDMPEYVCDDLEPAKTLMVNFASMADLKEFGELVGQRLTQKTRSIWFPPAELDRVKNLRYGDES